MIFNPVIVKKGTKLPELTSPGTASDMLAGKELIDQDGNVVTGAIPSLAAQTITPGTSNKTIASGQYLSGMQTIKGDANLVPANIVSGKSIFGVAGSYVGNGVYGTASYVSATVLSLPGLSAIPTNLLVSDGFSMVLYNNGYWRYTTDDRTSMINTPNSESKLSISVVSSTVRITSSDTNKTFHQTGTGYIAYHFVSY